MSCGSRREQTACALPEKLPERGRVRVGDQAIDCARGKLPGDKELAGFRVCDLGDDLGHARVYFHIQAIELLLPFTKSVQ